MKQSIIFSILAVFTSIVLCPAVYSQNSFRQVGYLKDNARNRIFTVAFKDGIQKSKIIYFAKRKMNTSGQLTAVYFYPEGSKIPADGVTLAGSIFRANYTLYDMPGFSKWRFAYMKRFNGTEVFVDCQDTPTDDLCRQ